MLHRANHMLLTRWLAVTLAMVATSAMAAAALPMRLSSVAEPAAYRLSLTIDPAQPRHRGEVLIDATLHQRLSTLTLHGRQLRIESAWIESGAHRIAARARQLDAQRIELRFARLVAAGPVRLGLSFSGETSDTDAEGLFRRRVGDRWQAATQFETHYARRAFPLFDEPGWKVPWTLTLTVPGDMVALAGTPVRQESPAAHGFKRIEFETTPPLPSYLLAFAVGDFELLDAGQTAGAAPIRIGAPRGRAAEARYAASVTGRLIGRLEAYFDIPYPFAKLDSIALAVPRDFGAMENVGLVTYADALLLVPPDRETARFQRGHVALAAHELAHQWFGNLVTMPWWDDLWLAESFASWIGDRVAADILPDGGFDLAVVDARQEAMRADRLPSARPIQRPMDTDDQLAGVFDAIVYAKGQSVLAMFEQWMGPERFRAGVRRYLQRHAWGHARSADFLAALGEQDARVPAALRSFIEQPGTPQVAVELLCDDGAPRLRLTQSPAQALGAPARQGRWQLPMRVRTPGGMTSFLMGDVQTVVPLPDRACPSWVQANDGGSGYYRAVYPPALRQALAASAPPAVEVAAALDDALELAQSGELALSDLLAEAEAAAQHPSRTEVAARALDLLVRARPLILPAQQAGHVARWRRAFGPRVAALGGWRDRAGDSDDDKLQRAELLPIYVEHAQDGALRDEALRLARAWLAGQSDAIAPGMIGAVLGSAALSDDAALFDALLQRLRTGAGSARERGALWSALGSFRDPTLARRAREQLLAPAVDPREAAPPLMHAHNRFDGTRDALLDFVRQHHAALTRRLGREPSANLPYFFDAACSDDDARRIGAVFGPHAAHLDGGRQALDRVLQRVRLCAAWRQQAWREQTQSPPAGNTGTPRPSP